VLAQALRDSVALSFGDHGLGSCLASLQGVLARQSAARSQACVPSCRAALQGAAEAVSREAPPSSKHDSQHARDAAIHELPAWPQATLCVHPPASALLLALHRHGGSALRHGGM
jgi:hypothetical protein